MRENATWRKEPIYKLALIDQYRFNGFIAKRLRPHRCQCNLCGKTFHHYSVIGNLSPASRKYDIPGMGIRFGGCPFCKSEDKERWLVWCLKNRINITSGVNNILHFAPEETVKNYIMLNADNYYISGDLDPQKADKVIDMTNICLENDSFDYIIASMVMEHIWDEEKAIKELLRIIKPGGKILLTTIVAQDLQSTLEKRKDSSEQECYERFGQEDHVRLYGKDVIERWRRYGATNVESVSPRLEGFTKKHIKRIGVHPDYTIYIIKG